MADAVDFGGHDAALSDRRGGRRLLHGARQFSLLQRYLVIAIVLPLFMGSVARTAGWIIILDNKGLLNYTCLSISAYRRAGAAPLHVGRRDRRTDLCLLPFMIVMLNSVMQNIDVSLEEASLNLGASALDHVSVESRCRC